LNEYIRISYYNNIHYYVIILTLLYIQYVIIIEYNTSARHLLFFIIYFLYTLYIFSNVFTQNYIHHKITNITTITKKKFDTFVSNISALYMRNFAIQIHTYLHIIRAYNYIQNYFYYIKNFIKNLYKKFKGKEKSYIYFFLYIVFNLLIISLTAKITFNACQVQMCEKAT